MLHLGRYPRREIDLLVSKVRVPASWGPSSISEKIISPFPNSDLAILELEIAKSDFRFGPKNDPKYRPKKQHFLAPKKQHQTNKNQTFQEQNKTTKSTTKLSNTRKWNFTGPEKFT